MDKFKKNLNKYPELKLISLTSYLRISASNNETIDFNLTDLFNSIKLSNDIWLVAYDKKIKTNLMNKINTPKSCFHNAIKLNIQGRSIKLFKNGYVVIITNNLQQLENISIVLKNLISSYLAKDVYINNVRLAYMILKYNKEFSFNCHKKFLEKNLEFVHLNVKKDSFFSFEYKKCKILFGNNLLSFIFPNSAQKSNEDSLNFILKSFFFKKKDEKKKYNDQLPIIYI